MKNYFDNFKRASIFFYGEIHNETAAVISTYIDTHFAITTAVPTIQLYIYPKGDEMRRKSFLFSNVAQQSAALFHSKQRATIFIIFHFFLSSFLPHFYLLFSTWTNFMKGTFDTIQQSKEKRNKNNNEGGIEAFVCYMLGKDGVFWGIFI